MNVSRRDLKVKRRATKSDRDSPGCGRGEVAQRINSSNYGILRHSPVTARAIFDSLYGVH